MSCSFLNVLSQITCVYIKIWNLKNCFFDFYQEIAESPRVGAREMADAEILDELTTSRGELKVRTVSFNEERRSQVTKFSASFLDF